jgi:hypothetical protein
MSDEWMDDYQKWQKWAYEQRFGKGSMDRDESPDKPPSGFVLYDAQLKRYWDDDRAIGIIERDGKFIGIACLVAKEVVEKESFVRKFGLSFEKDIQWHAVSSLLDHLSRSPMFKAVLITTNRIPFKLEPDIPEELQGRMNWSKRNYEYHKQLADTLKLELEGQKGRTFGDPVPGYLPKQMKEEEDYARHFLDATKSLESQAQEHLKNFFLIKDNLFAAALFFYVYTDAKDDMNSCVTEIENRKYSAKMEILKTYFVKCDGVRDPIIVFNPELHPFFRDVEKYYCIALAADVASFNSDKDVAIALKHFFTMALELPTEELAIEEKIHIPDELPIHSDSKTVLLGYLVTSVVKRQSSRRRVFFPLNELVKHGIITGGTGKGKTFFAMHLALEAASQGIKCLVVDPHGTFRFLPAHDNIEIEYVQSTDEVVRILQTQYDEALTQPIQTIEQLKKLIIIDEVSAGKFGSGTKKIMQILDRCLSETRKFGYGFVLICQYATESRGISAAARENAETFFIFRKKTVNELDRIKTLKHPSLNLIPYLEEGFFALVSEDFHPEPFFIRVPRIGNLLIHRK